MKTPLNIRLTTTYIKPENNVPLFSIKTIAISFLEIPGHTLQTRHPIIEMRIFGIVKSILPFLMLLIFTASPVHSHTDTDDVPPKFILIHLDSVSSKNLHAEIEAGNLPNIKETFYPGGIIPYVITYFPSKTPVVISSLRDGISPDESRLVGWAGVDSETGKTFSGFSSFSQMLLSKSRLAVTNILYGIPVIDRFAGLALANLPEALEKYRVLEFYWYAVDTYGHFYGEEPHLKKLRVFDKHLGRLIQRLDDDVNIVIYADHGMVFGEGVDIDNDIREIAGDRVKISSYPNLYINKKEEASETARMVVEETGIDFAFYKTSDQSAEGIHREGTMQFFYSENGIRYTYEESDPLGYYEAGYNGEVLSFQEWLELTHQLKYPVTPVKIFNFFTNPRSGDIITLMEPDKFAQSKYSRSGNHGGFTYQDLTIPILSTGPDVDVLQGRQTMWLRDLFHDIEGIDFGYKPSRDDHYLEWWMNLDDRQNYSRVSLSPWYRWRIGADLSYVADPLSVDHYQLWGKFDLFRSYLTRLWIGGGADFKNGETRPMGFVRHEFRIRKFQARSTLSTAGNHSFSLEFNVLPPVYLQVVNFNSLGLRLHF